MAHRDGIVSRRRGWDLQGSGQRTRWQGSRQQTRTIAALGLALGMGLAATADAARLRIAFIAYENPDQLLENVQPVVAYLKAATGAEVEAFTATDYAAVVEALANQTADIGFMGPLQYVIARQRAGAIPLLGEVYNRSSSYVSRIFVRPGRGISTLADLRGKTIAFTDPISSSGYLYPLDTFKSAGLIASRDGADQFFKKIYFAGGDEQAMRAVLNGFVDAAGVGQFAWNLLRPEERDRVQAIAESKPIPSHCVVARAGLDPQLMTALQQALLALNEGPNRGLLRQLYNVDGYVTVDPQTYAGVEQLAREYGFLR